MDRPIVYAVAVIVAGFLPIYVLVRPVRPAVPADGRHHDLRARRFADPGAHAAAGAVRLVLRGGVRERRNRAFEWITRPLRPRARLVPALARGARSAARRCCFAVALLLIPAIGAEFMPHLDEGALWVRATMPYTISFDESSRIVPQIRAILRSFPEVTVVAVGARPARRRHRSHRLLQRRVLRRAQAVPRVDGPLSAPRRELIDAIDEKLLAVSRRRRSTTPSPPRTPSTRPRPGLKSSLDVKIFGTDLHGAREEGGRRSSSVLEHVPRHHARDGGPGTRAAESHRQHRPREDRALRHQRGRRQRPDRGGRGRHAPRRRSCRASGSSISWCGCSRSSGRRPRQIGNILVATPGGQQIPLRELADDPGVERRVATSTARTTRATSASSISVEGRDLASAVQDAQQAGGAPRSSCRPATDAAGAASTRTTPRRATSCAFVLPVTIVLIFLILFALYRQLQVPADHRRRRGALGADRRHPRARAHRHALLGVVGHRLPRALRRVGADGRRLHLVRQRAAACRAWTSRARRARRRCCGCGRS